MIKISWRYVLSIYLLSILSTCSTLDIDSYVKIDDFRKSFPSIENVIIGNIIYKRNNFYYLSKNNNQSNTSDIHIEGASSFSGTVFTIFGQTSKTIVWDGYISVEKIKLQCQIKCLYNRANLVSQSLGAITILKPSIPKWEIFGLSDTKYEEKMPVEMVKAKIGERNVSILFTISPVIKNGSLPAYWPYRLALFSKQRYQIIDQEEQLLAELQGDRYVILASLDDDSIHDLKILIAELKIIHSICNEYYSP